MKWKAIAAFAVLSLTLTGCGKTEENPYSEPIVIDVYDSCSDYRGLQQGWYAALLQEKFNIQLNFMEPTAEAMMQADLLVCDGEKEDPQQLISNGFLKDIEPYLKEELPQASLLLGHLDSIEAWNVSFSQKGVYVLPSQVSRLSETTPSEEKVPLYGPYIQWDVYREWMQEGFLGRQKVGELEELPVLLQEMEKNAVGIVLCNDDAMDLLDHVLQICGIMGYELRGSSLYKDSGREYEELLAVDGGFRKGIDWLRQMYELGLIHKESFDYTFEEMKSCYEEGAALLHFMPQLAVAGYELLPMEEMEVVSHGCDPAGNLDAFLAVGVNAEHTERVVDFIGWLYSAEGIMVSAVDTPLKAAGPENLTWKIAAGNPTLTSFGRQVLAAKDTDAQVPEEWGGGSFWEGSCKLNFQPVISVEVSPSGYSYNYTLWDTTDETYGTVSASWQEVTEVQNAMEYLIDNGKLAVIPAYNRIKEDGSGDIVEKGSACRQIIVDYIEEMIQTKSDKSCDRLWDEMVKAAEGVGY